MVEEQVFAILAFSYNSLSNGPIKPCFLYCSMFPSHYEIFEDELVELWIGEGFLTKYHDIQKARDEGYDIIESLKVACLLESAESEKHVKMHDMIRDMALWLTTNSEEHKKKVVVKERGFRPREISEWDDAQKMSLWDIAPLCFWSIKRPPSCSNLETLLLRRSFIEKLPIRFFEKMPLIRVLDLSHNYRLDSLDSYDRVNELVNLEYLNLSFTNICVVTGTITREWKKLRCLIMNFTHIEGISVSNLSSLELFSMHGGRLHIPCDKQIALLKELENLEHINEISIILDCDISVKKLLSSYKLQSCIRKLHLQCCSNMTSLELSTSCVKAMVQLETLQLSSCNDLSDVKINAEDNEKQGFISRYSMVLPEFCKLFEVHIISCSKLLNLTWLIYAPCLRSLAVSGCESMKEVICGNDGVEENSGLFPRLTTLQLEDLENLESICNWVLHFPSLETIYVHSCKNLRKLPFDANTGQNSLKKIQAQQTWWDGLQWEVEAIKHRFNLFFNASEYMNLYQVLGYDY